MVSARLRSAPLQWPGNRPPYKEPLRAVSFLCRAFGGFRDIPSHEALACCRGHAWPPKAATLAKKYLPEGMLAIWKAKKFYDEKHPLNPNLSFSAAAAFLKAQKRGYAMQKGQGRPRRPALPLVLLRGAAIRKFYFWECLKNRDFSGPLPFWMKFSQATAASV